LWTNPATSLDLTLSFLHIGDMFGSSALIFFLVAQCSDCWLAAKGPEIVQSSTGEPVVLRGVGLGYWLLQENYMMHPQGCEGCPDNQWQMKRQYLQEGQSMAQIEAFYANWRSRFITRGDIEDIANMGFNCVRLPMHYELFLTGEQRAMRNAVILGGGSAHDAYKDALAGWVAEGSIADTTDLDGFQHIDDLIEWCSEFGLWISLDMHAAPGSQGVTLGITDGFYPNNLWEYPVFQDVLVDIWDAISDRYRDESRIAMYEFINEPNSVPGGGPAIRDLTQRLITMVRNKGDQHLIGVHGNGYSNVYDNMLPSDFSPNWGLVYHAHRYWIELQDDAVPNGNPNVINRMVDLVQFRQTHQVPIWVSETGENSNGWMAANIDAMEAAGVGWCHWTWKRHDVFQNAALNRIGGNYPTDGASAMNTVLAFIHHNQIIPNPDTRMAIGEDLPSPGSSGCTSDIDDCAPPIGSTISLQGFHGEYVSTNRGNESMTCDSAQVGPENLFVLEEAGDGRVALRGTNGRYVSSNNGVEAMTCDSTEANASERFSWVELSDGRVALRADHGQYASSNNGLEPMRCDRDVALEWESFAVGLEKTCPCLPAGDVNCDGVVGFADVLAVLAKWGACPNCFEDVNQDGAVEFADVISLLANWGGCTD